MSSDERAKAVIDFYCNTNEKDRLKTTYGKLEFAHMTELLVRYLPKAPAKICDIGGAAGDYAFFLAKLGYDIHLLDLVPRHIEQAKERAITEDFKDIDNFVVGDALDLPYADNSFDAVFLSGPLYHLPDKGDRIRALSEARRVLKPNGIMAAYSIGRYATMFYGISTGLIYNKEFIEKLKSEVHSGYRYKYCEGALDNAYFHLSEELKQEVITANLNFVALHGVIGAGWMAPDFDEAWEIEDRRNAILEIARMSEGIPDACSKIFITASK